MGCGSLTDSVRDYYDPSPIIRDDKREAIVSDDKRETIYDTNVKFYTKDGVVHILKGHKNAHTEIDKSKALRLALCKKCSYAYNNL